MDYDRVNYCDDNVDVNEIIMKTMIVTDNARTKMLKTNIYLNR